MSDWSHTLATAVGRWRLKRSMNHQAFSIAREIQPALWENVRRKIDNSSEEELTAYAKVRAAQLSQECVDVIMRENPTLAGAYATELPLKQPIVRRTQYSRGRPMLGTPRRDFSSFD